MFKKAGELLILSGAGSAGLLGSLAVPPASVIPAQDVKRRSANDGQPMC